MRVSKERIRLPKPELPPEDSYEVPPAKKTKVAAGISLSPQAAKKIRKRADTLMNP